LLENFVYAELRKKGIIPNFWRTAEKAEIDFVISINRRIFPIEVKFSPKIRKVFYSFIRSYNPEKALILSYTTEVKTEKKNTILFGITPCFFI
jgi:predicted AAA+ superfamily ATPase